MLREQAQMLDLANVMARDLDDRVILWNTGMEKMYGWLRAEASGPPIDHAFSRRDFPPPLEEIRRCLDARGPMGRGTRPHPQGRHALTVASHWVLHRDDQARPAAILEVNTDITERKRAEQQVLQMNVELEQRVQERTAELTAANNELEAFTYSVAHDLRAPLRHIDAFTRILVDEFYAALSPEARRLLENIRKGSQNMSRLVDDLLNLARVGPAGTQTQPTSLQPAGGGSRCRTEARNRRIARSNGTSGSSRTAQSDPGLLKQVFANLLSNAIKYTRPRAAAVIEIGQCRINGEPVIFVHDNGVGFNMKYADKLFGVFQRLHRADEFEGTGVGLATVERVVRQHGGRIWAESEMGRGATFYFTLAGLDKDANQN